MTETSTIKKRLNGIEHILWINLDTETERQNHMNSLFDTYGIKNTRISAVDARGDNDVSDMLSGRIPDNVSQGELGCALSHLKAIKHFYEETDDDYCLIMEDDVLFDTAKHWGFTWKDFVAKLPYDWDCVQLTVICTGDIHVILHHYFINDFSAAAYLITRHHAAKIIKNHIRGEKFKLNNGIKPRAVSEDTVLGSGITYSIPLFLYRLDLGSAIHPEHIDIFHRGSYNALENFWRNQGYEMSLDQLMNYDPYLNRISNPTAPKQ